MSDFFDVEIFSDRDAAQVRAASYAMGASQRRNVRVIETKRTLVHDSRAGIEQTRRIFDSGQGTFFVAISEG